LGIFFRLQQYPGLFPAFYAWILFFYTRNPLFKQISADGLLEQQQKCAIKKPGFNCPGLRQPSNFEEYSFIKYCCLYETKTKKRKDLYFDASLYHGNLVLQHFF
jgi:hypothetical protein